MYVTDDMIAGMAARYDEPHKREFEIPVTAVEYDRIRASQKHGRNHDVTLYIRHGGQLIVMAKHFYPPDLYRAPSGGLNPGESFEDGIAREVAEETGCKVKLDRFLLRTSVNFTHDRLRLFWRSFVFLADYVSGDFRFTDTHEVRAIKLADWEEFRRFGEIMRASELGGLHYRAALHETVVELIEQDTLRTGTIGES